MMYIVLQQELRKEQERKKESALPGLPAYPHDGKKTNAGESKNKHKTSISVHAIYNE